MQQSLNFVKLLNCDFPISDFPISVDLGVLGGRFNGQLQFMAAQPSPAPTREICPPGYLGRETLDATLNRSSERSLPHMVASIARWEAMITVFKHTLEIPLCVTPGDVRLKARHRSFLEALMNHGRSLLSNAQRRGVQCFFDSAYSMEFLKANFKYLEQTYATWYEPVDQNALQAAIAAISDECN